MVNRCPKCGTTQEPFASLRIGFDKLPDVVAEMPNVQWIGGRCKEGVCSDGEHLHLICRCGHSGISACADQQEKSKR